MLKKNNTEKSAPVWRFFQGPQPYEETLVAMAAKARDIKAGADSEIWVLEHASVFTVGTSLGEAASFSHPSIPVVHTGRGGKITYHGPGMLIVYPLLNLRPHHQDIRAYIQWLEAWMTRIVSACGVLAWGHEERIGLWVNGPSGAEEKIGAIGVRVSQWVTTHGFALNVCPNMQPFTEIVACGLKGFGVTSLERLGKHEAVEQVKRYAQETFEPLTSSTTSSTSVRPLT